MSEELQRIVIEVVKEQGCNLYHFERSGNKLEVYIDKEGGATLGDCESITRQLRLHLSSLSGEWQSLTLEVSTPGIERRLYEPEHFRRAVGERLSVKLAGEYVEGRLNKADEEGIDLEISGTSRRLTYNEILSARVARTTEELFKRR